MDGLINFNKPLGISSARALDHVRRLTRQHKSGHTGTLDPAADGVLVLCLGKATKMVERVMDQPKVYLARARLDVTSASLDAGRELIPIAIENPPTTDAVRAAFEAQEGKILQIPPAISALKVGGQRAYRIAAAGGEPLLAPRQVTIYWIVLRSYAWPEVEFEMACGRGAYVRAVIRDVGAALGAGGCLTALTRTRVGPFDVESSWSLEKIEHAREPGDYLVPCERAGELLSVSPVAIPSRPAGG